jgi:hypothetical protein
LAGSEGVFPNCKYQCNAGYVGTGTSVDGLNRGPRDCTACPAGTAAAAGAASCTDCGPGYFSTSVGSSACSICDANLLKYSIGTRNSVPCSDCQPCTAAGQYRKNCGGSLPGICDSCSNNQYIAPL